MKQNYKENKQFQTAMVTPSLKDGNNEFARFPFKSTKIRN